MSERLGTMAGDVRLDVAKTPVLVPALAEVKVLDSFEAARAAWLDLETRAVLTPYQRFDWMAAMYANGLDHGRLAIAVLGPADRPIAILPLVIAWRRGVRQARLIGSDYSNSDWLIFDPDAACRLTLPVLHNLLREVARQAGGVDIVRFSQLPARWHGQDNPLLAFRHQPAANNLYVAEIGAVPRPFIDHGITSKLRANLRRGRARLEEQFGPVSVRRIVDAAALGPVHDAFLAQRGERFAQMGIENVFATPGMVGFFRSLCARSLGEARPAFMAHALYAGDTILATSFGTAAGNHYSQYINSTSAGPASKYSLMGILMVDMLDDLIASGITGFDMGTGDFAYKADWSQPELVFDSAVAVSPLGQVALPVLDNLVRTKRAIKQNPRIWALARKAQKLRYDFVSKLRR
ncbi:GNAT family N-acetyltransferase [Devosia sp. UYZn731]|uniref:GNAT family N-acetyltransferase n=1 Tax=Devosia sp. UYZn731 TaxID=3156345 RepID=UPI0033934CCF